MSEQPTPTPASSVPLDDKKPKRTRAEIRKDYLDELTLATEVATAAAKAEYAAALTEEGIEPAEVAALQAQVKVIRDQITATTGKTTEKRSSTRSEKQLRESLLVQAVKVQARAKRVYELGDPRRDDYYIGKPIDGSRAQLEQASAALLKLAAADPKLKAGPELLTRLEEAREAYLGVQGEQSDRQTDAAVMRGSLATAVKALATARRNIQYAADAAWPARERVHGAIRREFKIPATRGLR